MIRFDKKYVGRGLPYYLAFSGGVDSLAAAHFLINGGYDITLLHVVHFDTLHSARIAQGCVDAASNLGYTLDIREIKSKDTPNEANAYSVRKEVFDSLDLPVIICSHLNDMGEKYFMNICAGRLQDIPYVAQNGHRIRPFLRTRKKDFMGYVDSKGLSEYVVPDYMRNERERLRREVFPVIGQDFTKVCYKLYINTGKIYSHDM